jgi:hypothetical protein
VILSHGLVWSKELYIKIKWNRLTSISKYDLENVYINKKNPSLTCIDGRRGTIRLPAVSTLKRYSKALEYNIE